ncbi:MAG TPA: hypothetical protein VJ820_01200 [Propionibacteriaceae bacterium]|nr:hypothetical protein [Propionibacteriaceae bacterium]
MNGHVCVLADGVKETTQTTGTGTYELDGALAGSVSFVTGVGGGNKTLYRAQSGTSWEIGVGTVAAGSPPTLARTEILKSSNSDNAVNWTAGAKDIFVTAPAALLDQYVTNGQDGLELVSTDAGATQGPLFSLYRNSDTAIANDVGPALTLDANNDAGERVTYARLRQIIADASEDSEDGVLSFDAVTGGTLAEIMRLRDSALLIGKTLGTLGATVGHELTVTGAARHTVDGSSVMIVNRLTDDGGLILLQQAGATEGTISVSGNTIAYGTFTGEHWGQWASGAVPTEDPPLGTVLITTDEEYERPESPKPQLCKVAISSKAADKRVYGVWGAPQKDEDTGFHVYALGTTLVRVIGPVEGGDLLQTSDIPGVAERQPDDLVRACTLGKVSRGDGRTDERLVAAVLYSG